MRTCRCRICSVSDTFLLACAGMNVLSVLYVMSMLVIFTFVGMQQIVFSMLFYLFSCYFYTLSDCANLTEWRRGMRTCRCRICSVSDTFLLACADLNKGQQLVFMVVQQSFFHTHPNCHPEHNADHYKLTDVRPFIFQSGETRFLVHNIFYYNAP